ncbi:biopolymer transporter ExbD [Arcobacter sp. LA11]|uniref:biopolymer transporter ExbD n=1 Tax=Arcobacter sp. LA11 TaxID=1898176 RepID=UPI000933BB3C|nr:biopolymer transporter ExbD [Arcobacter sp. LA11]
MKIKKFDSINVIPFIDVLLVLLAIVLMTSTFIAKGVIPISLPSASSSEEIEIIKDISIYIKSDNSVYLEKEKTSIEVLIQQISIIDKKTAILINSDKNAKIDTFVSILDLLKANDFENIAIVTKK